MNKEKYDSIGRNLKLLRINVGLTQDEMSSLLNLSRPCYTLYELGKRNPDIQTLYDISSMYNLDINDFFLESPSAFLNKLSLTIPDFKFKK